jgi:ketosteroid isomerase-like protein
MVAAERVRTLHQAFNARDRDGLLACLAADVRWHVPGESPMAGTYAGRDELWTRYLEPLWPSPARVEAEQVIERGEHAVAVGDAVHDFGKGERRFPTLEVFRLDGGLIGERWEFTSGQRELDEMLIRGCAAALEQEEA